MNNPILKSKIIQQIRTFFDQQGFQEVIIPVLHEAVPLEPNIYPFTTHWHANNKTQTFYLPTSPEKYLKKMLAEGIGNCYAIGHTFRDLEGAGSLHSPEFLMLEWYRENADYRKIMEDVENLFSFIIEKLDTKIFVAPRIATLLRGRPPASRPSSVASDAIAKKIVSTPFKTKELWKTLSMIDLFQKYTGTPLIELLDDAVMKGFARKHGYSTENASWQELYDQIFVNEIESQLPKEPFFLVDFPMRISPLCEPQKENPLFAQRFELYIDGIEIGNGNTERTDAEAVRKVFELEQEKRKKENKPFVPIDKEFLNSLRNMEGKKYAGIGLGVDRVVKLLTASDSV